MDDQFNETFAQIERLMCQHGVFHAKLHFSSSRAPLCLYSDPCRYRVLSVDELLTATPCQACPSTHYPLDAVVEVFPDLEDRADVVLHAELAEHAGLLWQVADAGAQFVLVPLIDVRAIQAQAERERQARIILGQALHDPVLTGL